MRIADIARQRRQPGQRGDDIGIAGDICIYTNRNFTIEVLE